ncbi:hypothetical protein D3C77_769230 [compost metagenome]
MAQAGVDVCFVITGMRQVDAAQGLTESEQRLLAGYRALANADQEIVHRVVGAMASAIKGNE